MWTIYIVAKGVTLETVKISNADVGVLKLKTALRSYLETHFKHLKMSSFDLAIQNTN